MSKNQPLLFILLLASTSTLQAHTSSWRDQLAHIKLKKEEIPTRVQSILDSQQDKFTQIEHYYPWKPSVSELTDFVVGVLIIPSLLAMVVLAALVNKMDKKIFILAELALALFVATMFGLIIKQEKRNGSENAGCFCLTNTGLLIIPPRNQPPTWLAYENMESVKHIHDYSIDTSNSYHYVKYSVKKIGTLIIKLKTGEENRDCSTSNMGGENYKNLVQYLGDKLKPYGKRIKIFWRGKEILFTKPDKEDESPSTDKSVQESQQAESPTKKEPTNQKEIPTRVQNILDGHKNKFTHMEHYYPWEVPFGYFTFFGGIVFEALLIFLIYGLIDSYFSGKLFENKSKEEAYFVFFGGLGIFLSMTLFFGWLLIQYYQDGQNPGCVILTDTGLLTIPPGKGKYDWLYYQDIKSASYSRTHVVDYGSGPSYNYDTLTIDEKSGRCIRMSNNLGISINIIALCKHLQKKLNPYSVKISGL